MAYVTVSICEDCKVVFPNRAIRFEGDLQAAKKSVVNVTVASHCPECGKEITTLVDTGYWLRVS